MSRQPAQAEVLAEAIRVQLSEKVNAPGLRALKAVLALQSDASLLQADVTKTFKTSKDSIRKYRELLRKLDPVAFPHAEASLHLVATSECEPGTAAAFSARPLLRRDWLASHLPNVREVRVVEASVTDEQGMPCRRLEIDVVQPSAGQPSAGSGAGMDVVSILVRHDNERDQESPSSRRSRQRANWDAEERAVRGADSRATADHRLRERERKSAKREADALVQYELAASQPATQPPPADKAWALPSGQRPQFVGEYVWVSYPQQLEKPQLGIVLAVWQNGCCDVQLLSMTSPGFATPIADIFSSSAVFATLPSPLVSPATPLPSLPPSLATPLPPPPPSLPLPTSPPLLPPPSSPSLPPSSPLGATCAPASAAMPMLPMNSAAMCVESTPAISDKSVVVSVDRALLVPVGDEELPYGGVWIGRLRHPRLAYCGEIGFIRTCHGLHKDELVITQSIHSDGSRSLVCFNPQTMAFDGLEWDLPAPVETLGSDVQLFEGLSDEKAAWAMGISAATFALKAHHRAECERLHPLSLMDREPLPCSCVQYCTAHSLPSEGAVCLWCAGPLQSAHHAVLNGWRSSPETRWCDVCPFLRAEIKPGISRLDCHRCGFDVCGTCARSISLTCQESGCRYLKHRHDCDSKKTDAQRFPERQALIKQQECELRSLQSARSLNSLAMQLELSGACIALSARLRCLDQIYPGSLAEERNESIKLGLASNQKFLNEMQPMSQNQAICRKAYGEKRKFWQMSEAERAKSNRSHHMRVWREGVAG